MARGEDFFGLRQLKEREGAGMARLCLWDREEWSINGLRCTGRLGWDWRGGAVQQSDATARRIEEEEVRSARG